MLAACLNALARQTDQDFEVIVIDNSGTGVIEQELARRPTIRVHRSDRNLGFAGAMNRACEMCKASFLATLNDDTEPHPGWLAALRREMGVDKAIGMCASQVRLKLGTDSTPRLDSAGMLMALDGSSKQRGHGQSPDSFPQREAVLFPSASAALYRREMLDDIGLFDADFFLYCEDTDLGLRARWNGWECVYVPEAVVDHHYSQSSSAASALKAWHVERNRLWVAAKNFPVAMLIAVPWHSALRYFWHLVYLVQNRGAAAKFQGEGGGILMLIGIILRAHWSLLTHFGELRRKRRAIRNGALLTDKQFASLVTRHSISGREIAGQ